MHLFVSRLIVLAICSILTGMVSGEESAAKLLGFTANRAKAETELEEKLDANIAAADQKAWLEQMASAPNHVGSVHDKANAEFMLAQFHAWGWEARIEEFQVLYPTPKKLTVELVSPTPFRAKLQEPVIAGDRTSTQVSDELPPYHAFGADGDVTAELVYVN